MLILKLDILETSIRCFHTEYCHTIRLRVILSKPRRFRIDGTSRALSASRQSSTSLRTTCGEDTSRLFSRNDLILYHDGIIRCYLLFQSKTTVVENLGWRPLNSFGSIIPSIDESYKKQMFALVQNPCVNFPFRQMNAGSTMLALPARVL